MGTISRTNRTAEMQQIIDELTANFAGNYYKEIAEDAPNAVLICQSDSDCTYGVQCDIAEADYFVCMHNVELANYLNALVNGDEYNSGDWHDSYTGNCGWAVGY